MSGIRVAPNGARVTVDDVVPVPLPEQLAARARDEPDRVALTFVDYAVDRSGTATSLTYGQLFSRVCAFSARIAARQERGSRLAIVAPQGLDYVVAFLGALRAGIVAVPLFSPDLPGHSGRLDAVFSDCEPAGVATTSAALPAVRTFLERQGGPSASSSSTTSRLWTRRGTPAPAASPRGSTRRRRSRSAGMTWRTCSTPPVPPGRRPECGSHMATSPSTRLRRKRPTSTAALG